MWIKYTVDSIFLNSSAPWACLQHEAKNPGNQTINTCKYDIYCKFIFPNFYLFDSSAQMDHLKFIKEEIYPDCKLALSHKKFFNPDKVNLFVNDLNLLDVFLMVQVFFKLLSFSMTMKKKYLMHFVVRIIFFQLN